VLVSLNLDQTVKTPGKKRILQKDFYYYFYQLHNFPDNSSSSSDSSSSDDEETKRPKKVPKQVISEKKIPQAAKKPTQSNLDLLLSLDEEPSTGGSQQNVMSPTQGSLMTPLNPPKTDGSGESNVREVPPVVVPTKTTEVLSKMTTGGLQVLYRFTRTPHLYSQVYFAFVLIHKIFNIPFSFLVNVQRTACI